MYIPSLYDFRNIFNPFLFGILLLFISACSKNKTGDDNNPPAPPVVNNVSGDIKKISISATPGKARVLVYEKDNLNRLVTISDFSEDSINVVTST